MRTSPLAGSSTGRAASSPWRRPTAEATSPSTLTAKRATSIERAAAIGLPGVERDLLRSPQPAPGIVEATLPVRGTGEQHLAFRARGARRVAQPRPQGPLHGIPVGQLVEPARRVEPGGDTHRTTRRIGDDQARAARSSGSGHPCRGGIGCDGRGLPAPPTGGEVPRHRSGLVDQARDPSMVRGRSGTREFARIASPSRAWRSATPPAPWTTNPASVTSPSADPRRPAASGRSATARTRMRSRAGGDSRSRRVRSARTSVGDPGVPWTSSSRSNGLPAARSSRRFAAASSTPGRSRARSFAHRIAGQNVGAGPPPARCRRVGQRRRGAGILRPDRRDDQEPAGKQPEGRTGRGVDPLQVVDEQHVRLHSPPVTAADPRRIAGHGRTRRAAQREVRHPRQGREPAALVQAPSGPCDRRPDEARLADAGLADDSGRPFVRDRVRERREDPFATHQRMARLLHGRIMPRRRRGANGR